MVGLLVVFLCGLLTLGNGQEIRRNSFVVHFAFNKYDTTEESAEALKGRWKELAAAMENPDSITITGFTDTVGTVGYNKILSLMRARHIAAWFSEVSAHDESYAGKIRVQAMGKQRPVSTIDSLNRRVELRFYYRLAVNGTAKNPDGDAVGLKDTSAAVARGGVIDTVVTLVNIFFVQNSPELTSSSRMAMPSVINSLKRYKDRNLRILGNCNSPGAVLESYDPLFILSVNRARVVYEYLIREGFDAQKLSYKGLGNSVMKNPHPYTREQMEENMRVDVEVYKK
jgi:outer membrane protein OmpA-like peptidoglycan-associated protein